MLLLATTPSAPSEVASRHFFEFESCPPPEEVTNRARANSSTASGQGAILKAMSFLLKSKADRTEHIDRCARIYLVRVIRRRKVPFAVEQVLRIQGPLPRVSTVS